MQVGAVAATGPIQQGRVEKSEQPAAAAQEAPPTKEASAAAEGARGVEVSISPEAAELARQSEEAPPKERATPAADMELTRALDGIDMKSQEGSETAGADEPKTRTTDPTVIAQAALAS